MAKKDQKKRDIILSQDNALTTARYKFDLIEKRALYCIIRNIRANYIEREDGQRTLFENLIITIKEEELQKCGDNTKMKNIYDALKRLRNRDIEINNEKMWLSIGLSITSSISKINRILKWKFPKRYCPITWNSPKTSRVTP